MPSDAAIASIIPVAPAAPIAPAQQQPGAADAARFAALVDGGETGEPALPTNLLPPGFTETPATAPDGTAAPAPAVPVLRPANDMILAPQADTPPQPQTQGEIESPLAPEAPELAIDLAPEQAGELVDAAPVEALPGETVDLASAGEPPVPVTADPAASLAQSLPITAQPTTAAEVIATDDTPADPALDAVRGARPAGKDAPSDTRRADASAEEADAMPPVDSAAMKAGAKPTRVAAKAPATGEDTVREASAKPTGPAPAPIADRPGAAVDLAVRTLYQAQPDAAAAPTATAVVQARSGQVGRDVGAVIRREIVSGREEVTVRLDPPELGRIQIRLSFESAGQLRAVVATETSAALDLLRRDVNQLDRALAEAGVQTDSQSFRFDDRQAGSGFGRSDGDQGGNAASPPRSERAESEDRLPIRQALHGRVASGRVDMIA